MPPAMGCGGKAAFARRARSRGRRCVHLLLAVVALAFPPIAHAQIEAPEVPPESTPISPPPVTPPPVPKPAPPVVERPLPPSSDAELPLAGVSDELPFLRSPDNQFVLFPTGLLQVDGNLYRSASPVPPDTFLIARGRLGVRGWIGPWVYYAITGDFAIAPPSTVAAPVGQANLATADDFVAIAPFRDLAILQVGQFDAPFTLENRTPDAYLDFTERSITVRAFGIPDNKQMGAMLHGFGESRRFLYSVGVFDGDGPGFRNVDNQLDLMGRAWIAPFRRLRIGGSAWVGDRELARAPASQTTQGGFTFLSFAPFPATLPGASTPVPVQLRQVGLLRAFAGELDVPINSRLGLRAEVVWKHSPLSEENVAAPAMPKILGGANLIGWSAYGEAWFWVVGDGRQLGEQAGMQPFPRLGAPSGGDDRPRDGFMVAVRGERLNEDVTDEADAAALGLRNPAVGRTQVTSFQLALNFWHGRLFRATASYAYNDFRGDTLLIRTLPAPGEHELAFRLALTM